MFRCIAFLRAINVGGHNVKMEDLRRLFTELGFANVESYIASGNIVFETNDGDTTGLEAIIEKHLQTALGYEVTVFLRSPHELASVTGHSAFPATLLEQAAALNVAFLKTPLAGDSVQKLAALNTGIDQFHAHGSHIYWLCRVKQSQSTFSNTVLEKTLKIRSTLRGMSTLQKMAARYSGV